MAQFANVICKVCPVPTCAYIASAVRDDGTVMRLLLDHITYAHPERIGQPLTGRTP